MTKPDDHEMDSFSLYFKYDRLPTAIISRLLKEINSLHTSVQGSVTSSQYMEMPRRFPGKHALLIDSVNTGNSIKFKFKEGWIPDARYTGDAESWYDVEIGIPKKLGTAAVVGYLLLLAGTKVMKAKTDYLEMRIKEYEHALVEQQFMGMIESFSARGKLDHAVKSDTLLFHLMDIPYLDDLRVNDTTLYTLPERD